MFHTKMMLKEFDLKHYMFHTKPEELSEQERKVITDLLWKEMREIYYARNIPCGVMTEMPGGAFCLPGLRGSAPPGTERIINAAA